MTKTCLDCGNPIIGRADKKFCDDQCRNNYNNKLRADESTAVKNINAILFKNRKILEKLNPEGKTKISKAKLEKAVKETGIQTVVIAGGVSANSELRKRLLAKKDAGWKVGIPKMSYCTDNAAMIAMAGSFYLAAGHTVGQDVASDPRLKW